MPRQLLALALLVCACSGGEEPKTESAPQTQPPPPELAPGLEIEVLQPGKEGTEPKRGERVSVHYTGWLTDGTKFDSSVDRGEPFTFTLGQGEVIHGWDRAVARMTEGSKARLTIPPDLAYGSRGRGQIPANATLVFEVELLKVLRPPAFRAPDPARQKTTASGLKYEVLAEGAGAPPRADQGVKLTFAVWSKGGDAVFSTEMDGAHVNGSVEGLQLTRIPEKFLEEAALLMKPGARLLCEVPPELCWGVQQVGRNVPPNSTTVWQLELVAVHDVPPFEAPDPAKMTTTESGLAYEVLREGTGPAPTARARVTVHYAGWLTDGTPFDSSYARGEPATFGLGQVIKGWTEGLQLMKEGGQVRFVIPPELGYGARQSGKIPPNSTLVFLVDLLKVE